MAIHITPKLAVSAGRYVKCSIGITCVAVSETRLQARPRDKELIDALIDSREEEFVFGESDTDPSFASMMPGMVKGQVKSWELQCEEYDPENVIALPIEQLLLNSIKREQIRRGMIINRDLLRGKCKIDDAETDLEIIDIKRDKQQTYVILDSNEAMRGLRVRYDVKVTSVSNRTVPSEASAAE
jgi:FKBP-type peptidyl-prolyl cis-trans isomerase 2